MYSLTLTKLILFLSWSSSFLAKADPQRIFDHGDIIIGGLFPLHSSNTSENPCDLQSLDIQVLLESEVMVYAIEQINNASLLSNVKIGYDIHDTCSNVSMALNATLKMAKEAFFEECVSTNDSYGSSSAKAVVGELASEVSVSVARLLALARVPQISYGSTSELLSSRSKFPSFFRTVPSDKHQTEAIAQLVHEFNFVPVGIIGSEDEYGKYGAESLRDYLAQYSVCEEFKVILPADFSENHSMMTKLRSDLVSWRAEAIVLFTQSSNAKIILEEAIKIGLKRTWIASDAWSNSKEILSMPDLSKAGWILGVTCKKNKVPGFKEYMDQFLTQKNNKQSFLQRLLSQREMPLCIIQNPNCSSFVANPEDEAGNSILKKCLMDFISQDDSYESYGVYMAVNVIAQALKSLLQGNNNTHFPAWMLTEKIKQVNFSLDNTTYIFLNENGEVNIGYDILQWNAEGPGSINIIGTFVQNITLNKEVTLDNANQSVTPLNCCKSCSEGYELFPVNKSCCMQCRKCDANFFSKGGRNQCQPCRDSDDPQCKKVFVEWTNPFSITLTVFSSLAIIITMIVTVLFVIHARTPIVRAAGGYLCFPTLLSLIGCFSSVFFFLGDPTDITCKTGLPLFGLSFTVCISCILANLLQIFVGFEFKLTPGDWLKRVNQPPLIVLVCVSMQVVVCVLWLVQNPPYKKLYEAASATLITCDEGGTAYFISMLTYIGLLCMVCFIFAYKGRRLPDLYKNASFITISMMIYLVVWIIFIPVYVNDPEIYEQAVEAGAILVSSYAILGCHFAPKCYIMIWKKELNNENAIVDYIRKHYENKGITVIT